jgi:hypothetical protein
MDQAQLIQDIEKLFADATPANLRPTTRQLERLVREVGDRATRARYEAAIDHLPEMVKHLSEE